MKKIIKILIIAFLIVVVIFIGCIYFFSPRPPKEAELIENFNQHRAAFEKLRDMLQADTNLNKVANWGVEIQKPFFRGYPAEADFPVGRFNEYCALLKEVGGLSAARRKGRHPDPNVLVWAADLGGDATHIWIGWLDDPPTNQVPSSTGYFADPSISTVFFKHIDQNWYLGSDGQIPAAR